MSNSNLENKKDKLNIIKTDKRILNKYGTYISNVIVQPDSLTEMGVPIPDDENVESAREFQEENEQ